MAIRFGIHAGPQDSSYDDLKKLWHIADTSGFYWASVWDHFYENPTIDGRGACFEGFTTMAALAAETRNVRVGSLVFSVGYRNPALTAKAATTIDHISNGRLELGIGAGWYELEYRAYGYNFPPIGVRMDMLEEATYIIKSMLTEEETSYQGKYFSVDKAFNFPRPVQKKPRLWIGGQGEKRTLHTVAKYADGWNIAYVGPEVYQRKAAVLDQWCEKEGRDPTQITHSINLGFYMGANKKRAKEKREEFEAIWAEELKKRQGGMLLGTHGEAIEQLSGFVDVGITDINIALRAPFDLEALQSFIEDVMPAFK